MLESNAIIEKFATENNVDMSTLDTYNLCFQDGNDEPSVFKTLYKLAKYARQQLGGFAEMKAMLNEMTLP